jgi:hypothetical protein
MTNLLSIKALEEEKQPKAVSFGEAIMVEDEQPKTPPVQEERKPFFDERPASSSAAAAAAAPVTSVFDDDVDVVPRRHVDLHQQGLMPKMPKKVMTPNVHVLALPRSSVLSVLLQNMSCQCVQ